MTNGPITTLVSLTKISDRPFDLDGNYLDIDLGPLITHLILSDRIIVKSSSFREVPALVQAFGLPAVLELLGCGLLDFYCHYVYPVDYSLSPRTNPRRASLPPLSFHFGAIEPMGYVHRGLRNIEAAEGLTIAETNELQRAVVATCVDINPLLARRPTEELDHEIGENRGYLGSPSPTLSSRF